MSPTKTFVEDLNEPEALRGASGMGPPVDGVTVAWFAGQRYLNETSGTYYRADTSSTDPRVSGAGSTWVSALSGRTFYEDVQGDLTATFITQEADEDRDLIVTLIGAIGIGTSSFHLSTDPSAVGTLEGQPLAFPSGTAVDLYLVGLFVTGPGGAAGGINDAALGVHFQGTSDGTTITWSVVSTRQEDPGTGDWATRSFNSLPVVSFTPLSTDFDQLVSATTPSSALAPAVGVPTIEPEGGWRPHDLWIGEYSDATLFQVRDDAGSWSGITRSPKGSIVTGVGASRLVFQPGGPDNDGPVFNDFVTLVAFANATGLPTTIDFDSSFGGLVIPEAGSPHVFDKSATFQSNKRDIQTLTFADGASVVGVAEFNGFALNIQGTTGGSAARPGAGQSQIAVTNGRIGGVRLFFDQPVGNVVLSNVEVLGGGPFFRGPFVMALRLYDQTSLADEVVHPDSNATYLLEPGSTVGTQTGLTGEAFIHSEPVQAETISTAVAVAPMKGRGSYIFTPAADITQPMPDPSRDKGPLLLKNSGPGTVTLTGAVGTPAELAPGDSTIFKSDGVTWEGFAGAGSSANVSASGTAVGHYRVELTADNTAGLPGAAAIIPFETYSESIDEGGIASFDGSTLTITSKDYPVKIESVIQTVGTGAHSGSTVWWEDGVPGRIGGPLGGGATAGPNGSVSWVGSYGQNAPSTPSGCIIPANTTFALQLAHSGSANNQRPIAGSYIEVQEIRPLTVSGGTSRIGEMVFAKTGRTIAEGYLPVVAGTVVDGAIDYPLWAAMYPEFVAGNDIVFPAEAAGLFLRNLGGNAGVEATFQDDATARNGLNVTYTRYSTIPTNSSTGGNNGRWRGTLTANAGVTSTDPETRPVNMAFQLYTIVDTYEGSGSGAGGGAAAPADWVTISPMVIRGVTTDPTPNAGATSQYAYQVDGKTLHMRGTFSQAAAGVNGSGLYFVELPAGFTIDTTHAPLHGGANGTGFPLGHASVSVTGFTGSGVVVGHSATAIGFVIGQNTSTHRRTASTFFSLGEASHYIAFTASIPIV